MEGNSHYRNCNIMGDAGEAEAKVIGGVPEFPFYSSPGPIIIDGDHRVPDLRQLCSPGDIAQQEEAPQVAPPSISRCQRILGGNRRWGWCNRHLELSLVLRE